MKIVDWDIDLSLGKLHHPYIGSHHLDSWGRDLYIYFMGLTLYLAWEW